ncbi:hypothetical protein SBA6_140010 [Candidatus Sulfopaludibacter sp. SbA6]|nr:hypothetical protein SBA6_140010 [Candidatus Sulfopaludibacter sp. SbA6]
MTRDGGTPAGFISPVGSAVDPSQRDPGCGLPLPSEIDVDPVERADVLGDQTNHWRRSQSTPSRQ